MTSYRCTKCDERWPVRPEFSLCPDCLIPTGRHAKDPTVSDSQINHGLFEHWCRTHGRNDERKAA